MNKQGRELQAIAGHFSDLYKLAAFKFSNPHSSTKFRAIKGLKHKTGAKAFVETGTYLGVTTNRCASVFDSIYTIELDPDLAHKAQSFLSRHPHIEVLQGDAVEKLESVLQKTDQTVLVFLDGHFSGGDTACGDMPEPAIEELKILSRFREKVAGILIDDFRLFGTEPGFPSKSALFKAIEDYFPGYRVDVALDQIHVFRHL